MPLAKYAGKNRRLVTGEISYTVDRVVYLRSVGPGLLLLNTRTSRGHPAGILKTGSAVTTSSLASRHGYDTEALPSLLEDQRPKCGRVPPLSLACPFNRTVDICTVASLPRLLVRQLRCFCLALRNFR